MKGILHLSFVLLVMSRLVAQSPDGPAQVRKLQVLREGNDLRIEVMLSTSTTPSVEVATAPDRLVLVLPNTISDAKQQRVAINTLGVRAVRIGLNTANPPLTRVVIDLDQPHTYALESEGSKVVLKVHSDSALRSGTRRNGPPPAASGPRVGIFHRQQQPPPPVASGDETADSIPVPAPQPPINFPGDQSAATPTASANGAGSDSNPSALRPSRGSLQQGTVFPGLGAPGTGNVPKGATATTGLTQSATIAANGGSQTPSDVSQNVGPPAAAPASSPGSGGPSQSSSATTSVSVTAATNTGATSVPSSTPAPAPVPPPVSTQPASMPTAEAVANTNSAPAPSSTPAPAPTPLPPPVPTQQASISSAGAAANTGSAPAASAPLAPTPLPPPVPAQPTPISGGTAAPSDAESAASSQKTSPGAGASRLDRQAVTADTSTAQASAAVPSEPAAQAQPGSGAAAVASVGPAPIESSAGPVPVLTDRTPSLDFRTAFRVKYVAQGAAYLDGGRSAGLAEGMKLYVRDNPSAPSSAAADPNGSGDVAELQIISVAESSAVTEIHAPKRDVKPGDLAYLSAEDKEALVQKDALSATRKYPTVVSFTEGDTLDEEARAEVPKPPSPAVNRARGRFGFDYMGTVTHGTPSTLSSDIGMVVRTDITRIGGTYWNISGYWRGRLNSTSGTTQPTLQDLINRTYHLSLTYDNPQSPLVAGVGRMYLPWAPSLDTIDGGYFGGRPRPGMTVGIFAGSTPDPTSWDYNPGRRMGGAFINFEGGSFDAFRYSSTSGMGASTINWQFDRPFIFLENSFFFKRYLSIYHSLQADNPTGTPATPSPGPGIGRSFLTVRFQPISRLELDFNHTYFRDVPTFDPTLIGTGLLDKYLFQGFSAGARVEVIKQIWLYTDIGQSNRTGDAKNSLNQAYGITFGHLPWVGLRADAHYSRFSSSFGDGSYRALSLSRNINDNFRLEVLAGDQNFSSTFTSNNRSRFVNANVESPLGSHYFLQGGFTVSRGQAMSYDQWFFTLGYRFDSRQKRKGQ